MQHAFNLTLNENDFHQLLGTDGGRHALLKALSKNALNETQRQIRENFKKYIVPNSRDIVSKGVVNLSEVGRDWFPVPNPEPHVFLSHSHDDLGLTLSFAAWLKERFGIRAFIDAAVWGNANDLLRMIDNEYCLLSNGNYDYSLRNRSTAYVHMLLFSALMTMIDITPCFIFINTPNSADWDCSDDETTLTASPWIYGELNAANLIARQNNSTLMKSLMEGANVFNLRYEAQLDAFTDLNADDLMKWKRLESVKRQGTGTRGDNQERGKSAFALSNALETLYQMKGLYDNEQ